IVPMILEKANAVEDFRNLIGATDPKKAAPGTIRALFAKSIEANAIHGSDSDENAVIESNFFFSELERFYDVRACRSSDPHHFPLRPHFIKWFTPTASTLMSPFTILNYEFELETVTYS